MLGLSCLWAAIYIHFHLNCSFSPNISAWQLSKYQVPTAILQFRPPALWHGCPSLQISCTDVQIPRCTAWLSMIPYFWHGCSGPQNSGTAVYIPNLLARLSYLQHVCRGPQISGRAVQAIRYLARLSRSSDIWQSCPDPDCCSGLQADKAFISLTQLSWRSVLWHRCTGSSIPGMLVQFLRSLAGLSRRPVLGPNAKDLRSSTQLSRT